MTILVSDLCKNSSLFSLIVALLRGVHSWIARQGSSLLCVNVQPFCPMWKRFNWSSYKQLMLLKCRNHSACSTWIVIHDLRFLMVTNSNRGKLIWHPYSLNLSLEEWDLNNNNNNCPRRHFAQKAKSRGGTLVTRAYIKESTYSWNIQSWQSI